MKIISVLMGSLCLLFSFVPCPVAGELPDLFNRVEKLALGRKGYVLGAVLDKARQELAAAHSLPAAAGGTYKFKDKGVTLVVDRSSHRVIMIYEHFDAMSQQGVRELTGALFLDFDEPTVMAHDSLVYWAYDSHGKVSAQRFDMARGGEKPLEILATVKLNSGVPIVKEKEAAGPGAAYYVISSTPLLHYFKN